MIAAAMLRMILIYALLNVRSIALPSQRLSVLLRSRPDCLSQDVATQADCLLQHLYPEPETAGLPGGGSSATYGELSPAGLHHLFRWCRALGVNAGSEDEFIDLGSGFGKLVLQAFVMEGVGASIGVEVVPERHGAAAAAANRMAVDLGTDAALSESALQIDSGGQRLKLVHGDMFESSLASSTLVFACSTAFPIWMIARLTTKLQQDLTVGAVFWTLKQLRVPHRGIVLIDVIEVMASWSARSTMSVHVYMRVPDLASSMKEQPVFEEIAQESAVLHKQLQSAGVSLTKSESASEVFHTSRVASGRLVRIFGRPAATNADDVCGCRHWHAIDRQYLSQSDSVDDASASSLDDWAFMELDVASMLAQGMFNGSTSMADSLLACSFPELQLDSSIREVNCTSVASLAARSIEERQCLRASQRRTVLHLALRAKSTELSGFLRQLSPRAILCSDVEGRTPLHFAAILGLGGNQSDAGVALAHYIRGLGPLKAAEAQAARNKFGRTPLFFVRNSKTLQQLVSIASVDLNVIDLVGETVLDAARKRGDKSLVDALVASDSTVRSAEL